RKAVEGHGHHAAARGAAVLDARDHLLSDEAALVEIDAAELVHVGLMWKCIAVDEIEAAARDAKRDAMPLVGRRFRSDEAALVEIDAAELVHVGLMWKCIAVDEIEAAARDAKRDAMRLVGRRFDELSPEIGRRVGRKVRRQHAAQA